MTKLQSCDSSMPNNSSIGFKFNILKFFKVLVLKLFQL